MDKEVAILVYNVIDNERGYCVFDNFKVSFHSNQRNNCDTKSGISLLFFITVRKSVVGAVGRQII